MSAISEASRSVRVERERAPAAGGAATRPAKQIRLEQPVSAAGGTRQNGRVDEYQLILAITREVLRVAVIAHEQSDSALLARTGVSPEAAQRLTPLTEMEFERLVTAVTGSAVTIEVDNEQLLRAAAEVIDTAQRRQWEQELTALGASVEMLHALNLVPTPRRVRKKAVLLYPDVRPVGRPRTFDEDAVLQLHDFWNLIARPERLHPVEHLINTCRVCDVSAAVLWSYISSHPCRWPDAGPDDNYPWKHVMFPHWGDDHT